VAVHGGQRDGASPPAAPAATLLALFEEAGEARVILIRRAQALPVHAGEVGLPGGRVQPGEAMVQAALRETAEEIGIRPVDVEVVGWLDPVVGRTSGSVALPVIGLLGVRPHLRPDPAEVEAVFDVSLAELLAEGVFREERWDVPVPDRPVYFFELADDTVWGMTARVLYRLLALVTMLITGRTEPPPPERPPGQAGTRPPGSV
jgi:8-oxo-dGTP pyrophosphatase MutT (NUDIX family)